MLRRLTSWPGPLPRFLLGMAGILMLLALTAALWLWLPAWPRTTLASQRGTCQMIHMDPNGRTLVAVHPDALTCWDLATGQELGTTPYRGPHRLHFAPDGQQLAVVEQSLRSSPIFDSVRLWQPARESAPVALPGFHDVLGFTSDGKFLAGANGETCKLWDVAANRERAFPVLLSRINYIDPLRDGRIVVTATLPEAGWLVDEILTKLWVFNADLTLASDPIHLPANMATRISPDGRLFTLVRLPAAPPWDLKLHRLSTGREVASFSEQGIGWTPLFSPDGTRLVIDHKSVWDITTAPPRRIGSVADGLRLDFSPDGKWLRAWPWMSGPADTEALLDAATFTKLPLRPGVIELTFAPDSQTIAGKEIVPPSGFAQLLARCFPGCPGAVPYEALQVWTFPDWQEVASYPHVRSFTYFPDGRRMAVGLEDGTIELWDLPPRRPWWIDNGLPVLFVLLMLFAVRLIWRAFRNPPPSEPAPC